MSDTGTIEQRTVPRFAENERKPAARKAAPAQFIHRITVGIDNSEMACLEDAKRACRWTENQVLRWALDLFLKSQGYMTPDGEPVNSPLNNGGTNGRPGI